MAAFFRLSYEIVVGDFDGVAVVGFVGDVAELIFCLGLSTGSSVGRSIVVAISSTSSFDSLDRVPMNCVFKLAE